MSDIEKQENVLQNVDNADVNSPLQVQASNEQEQRGVLFDYNDKYNGKIEKKKKLEGVFQFIKYALCAASAGIIQLVLFTILQAVIPATDKTIHFITEDMELVAFIATTVALCASILWNFTFNRKFTFKDASNVPKAMILAFLFYVPFYPFQTWYVGTIKKVLMDHMNADLAGIIAEGSVMVINFVLEFIWQKFVVFRKPKAKEELAEAEQENAEGASEESIEDTKDEKEA